MTNCEKPYTDKDKWIIVLISALLFALIASPYLYGVTGGFARTLGFELLYSNGQPKPLGLIVHAVIFALIIRLMMR